MSCDPYAKKNRSSRPDFLDALRERRHRSTVLIGTGLLIVVPGVLVIVSTDTWTAWYSGVVVTFLGIGVSGIGAFFRIAGLSPSAYLRMVERHGQAAPPEERC